MLLSQLSLELIVNKFDLHHVLIRFSFIKIPIVLVKF